MQMPVQQFESGDYRIVVKNERLNSYRFFALILVLLNVAVFIFLLAYDYKRYEATAALLLLGIYFFIRSNIAKKNNQKNYIDEIMFFVLAGCWVGLQNYILAVCCILLGILFHVSLQKTQFVFTAEGVHKLNFPKAMYEWDQFTNVMIKDKILTLDFKNNKLMQVETEQEAFDELTFNKFAKQQIAMQNEISIK